jgi:hypothetical protein
MEGGEEGTRNGSHASCKEPVFKSCTLHVSDSVMNEFYFLSTSNILHAVLFCFTLTFALPIIKSDT